MVVLRDVWKRSPIQHVLRRADWSIVVIALVGTALVGATRSTSAARAGEEDETRIIHILAERFFFVPSRLRVKFGETVEFRIRSADTNHGFRIRKAGINVVIPKRGKGDTRVRFHADKKGSYAFECSKACGAGHNMMRGTIIVK